jgi:glycosyltransferase 2 family protein
VSKSWHRYFVYASVVFVGVVLYRFDYLRVPSIASLPILALTFPLQLVGFAFLVASWNVLLANSAYPVRFADGLAALGLSVLGNYMPGKVWLIMGRAGYIAERHGYPLAKVSVLSLHAQLISLWSGLALGALGAFAVGGVRIWGPLILILWLALSLTIFSRRVHAWAAWVIARIVRRHVSIPLLSLPSSGLAAIWALAAWLCWSLAFYLFLLSLGLAGVTLADGLAFPLAATLGVVAIIAPGGLGAREGVLVAYLVLAGQSAVDATSVAVAARLWFLIGELSLFAVGWLIHSRLAARSA